MKDSQDWLDEILELLVGNFAAKYKEGDWWGYDTNLGNQEKTFEHAKSAIRKRVLQEALSLVEDTPKLRLSAKFQEDFGLLGEYVSTDELRNKFNDTWGEK